jgi:hypothetical protein
MKRALAAVGALSLVLATGVQAATQPPIRVVSRPFSLAHGDPLTITVYDRPPQLRDICTSVALPNRIKGGGCWRRSQVITSGSGPDIFGINGAYWISGLGKRGTTTAIARVHGHRFVLHERGPWRAWMLPHAITNGLSDARDVSITYR